MADVPDERWLIWPIVRVVVAATVLVCTCACTSALEHFEAGQQLETRGDPEGAAEHYIAALERDATLTEARVRLEPLIPQVMTPEVNVSATHPVALFTKMSTGPSLVSASSNSEEVAPCWVSAPALREIPDALFFRPSQQLVLRLKSPAGSAVRWGA